MTGLDILLALFVLLIAGISLIVKTFTRRKHRRLLKEFTPLSERLQWKIEESEVEGPAIRLQGETASGIEWEMILAGRDRKGNHLSRWHSSEVALEGGAVVIGYVPQGAIVEDVEEELTPEEMRAEVLWRKVYARFGEDVPEEVTPYEVGSLSFREYFSTLALARDDISHLLDSSIEALLLEWTQRYPESTPPLILFTGEGLTLATEQLDRFDAIEDLVKIGTMMAEKR
ncbi:MAG: hypothetical protein KDD67_18385 [Ignavibacteriae bacterium]|nr:hypothetical protein [Ignavibacteriota bacterium]MCB9214516.1 hypothetical protein [Ignavibacteria bacterium]